MPATGSGPGRSGLGRLGDSPFVWGWLLALWGCVIVRASGPLGGWHGYCSEGVGMTSCVNSGEARASAAEPVVYRVRMPTGLLGFESIREYTLSFHPDEAPFGWLEAADGSGLAFVVVDPFLVVPEYRPDIPPPDVALLGLNGPEDALLLNIVTIHGPRKATVNLKGPVVINRHTWVGKQVVIGNAIEYSVQHPLPVPESGD